MTQGRFSRPDVPAPFSAEGRCTDAGCTVVVEGEVDLATSPALEQEIERHDHDDRRPLRLDLASVGFLDSSGLGVLLQTRDRLAANDRDLTIVAPSGPAMRAIELTGLQRVLPLTPPR